MQCTERLSESEAIKIALNAAKAGEARGANMYDVHTSALRTEAGSEGVSKQIISHY